MRDFLLNEALKRLAAEAAIRLSALVAGGEQIPFDVAAEDGDESAFYSYVPLTSRFVARARGRAARAARLRPGPRRGRRGRRRRPLPGGARRDRCPPTRGERAAQMLIVFLASLWEGCTEFSLDRERLDERARRCSTPRPATPTRPTS